MGKGFPRSTRHAEAALSLIDKRALILAYQTCQQELYRASAEDFGEAFDEMLDEALSTGDADGLLSRGARGVLLDLRETLRELPEEWPLLRSCLDAALPHTVTGPVFAWLEDDL
ncbi:hypothetical protein AL036_12665 [Salipiger aestuarii]|uniref:Uncharacterized protein n=1 Tax=Salipiger aestuarii TaxID=568098 RepID=A0A327XZ16_9RHOB|nr:hypothetical protein [Salipiger aestuarii]EIE50234.1 hypothetical protein C357_14841 [Citreicella sp. 357]KAA8606919.1 hypothetical protein AL036_12665 [Salipiger aestuarii]KAA8610797.1 hypothetical protein AL037_12000 [Salipiger aestuarii]KAB2541581.1 hypothetical protein AL035_11565 [Salipiger aestuarii]RAK14228.1 hypothetical protein ATI53_102829 [Salipiger aestuarii]